MKAALAVGVKELMRGCRMSSQSGVLEVEARGRVAGAWRTFKGVGEIVLAPYDVSRSHFACFLQSARWGKRKYGCRFLAMIVCFVR